MSATYLMECTVAGVSFDNPDGSSRQDEIARCVKGEDVILSFEKDNPHDPGALAVLSMRHVQIGYISKSDKIMVLEVIADDTLVSATISSLYGGTAIKPLRGVILDLECKDE